MTDFGHAIAVARRDRNIAATEGNPWREHPTLAVRWCTDCAGWYTMPRWYGEQHRHHFAPPTRGRLAAAGIGPGQACSCLPCEVRHAQTARVQALVVEALGPPAEARRSAHAARAETWRPEARADAEKAIGRPLGPRERVRRLPDGTVQPPSSFTVTGPRLAMLEVHARWLGATREEALDDLLTNAARLHPLDM